MTMDSARRGGPGGGGGGFGFGASLATRLSSYLLRRRLQLRRPRPYLGHKFGHYRPDARGTGRLASRSPH